MTQNAFPSTTDLPSASLSPVLLHAEALAAPLTLQQAQAYFGAMLDGDLQGDEIEAILRALAERGESAQEIMGAAAAMRARMVGVEVPPHAMDIVGTGGDGAHSLNISTACALVVAACGVPVAKHGNRAASSKAGGADTLEALGLDLAKASAGAEASLRALGIAYLFAQKHHPALAGIAPIRRKLARRTIFNLLGPLCNPAHVRTCVIGVPSEALFQLFATLDWCGTLGYARVLLVHSGDGLDELTLAAPNHVRSFGFTLDTPIDAEAAGLPLYDSAAIKGGDPAYNAAEMAALIAGKAGAYRDTVVLNAAAALLCAGKVGALREGVALAQAALDTGKVQHLLDEWRKTCA
jgi:anthranilate phosphoribosyltransferase